MASYVLLVAGYDYIDAYGRRARIPSSPPSTVDTTLLLPDVLIDACDERARRSGLTTDQWIAGTMEWILAYTKDAESHGGAILPEFEPPPVGESYHSPPGATAMNARPATRG